MLVITVLTLTFGGCNNKISATSNNKEDEKALMFKTNSTELSTETLIGVGII